jgi:hypothetical protein
MPRSYWRVFLTAVCGLTVAIWAFVAGLNLGALNYPSEPRYQTYRYAPGDVKAAEAALITRPNSIEYRQPCNQPQGQDESDLCAQWKAARAAEEGAFWTKATFWIGPIGIVVTIIGTLLLLRTIRQGDEGLKAARDGIDETRRIGEAQVRCYMSMPSATIEIDENALLIVRPTMMNSGQSPARSLRWTHRISCRSVRGPEFHWKSKREEINRDLTPHTYAAGERYSLFGVTADLVLDRESSDTFWECERVQFEVKFDVEWQDVFGLPFSETFYYEADTPVAIGGPTELRQWRGLEVKRGPT